MIKAQASRVNNVLKRSKPRRQESTMYLYDQSPGVKSQQCTYTIKAQVSRVNNALIRSKPRRQESTMYLYDQSPGVKSQQCTYTIKAQASRWRFNNEVKHNTFMFNQVRRNCVPLTLKYKIILISNTIITKLLKAYSLRTKHSTIYLLQYTIFWDLQPKIKMWLYDVFVWEWAWPYHLVLDLYTDRLAFESRGSGRVSAPDAGGSAQRWAALNTDDGTAHRARHRST